MSDLLCICGRVMLNGRPTGSRNWNPECTEHGTASDWWNSDEQQAKRAATSARTRDLARRAAEARRGAAPRREPS